MGCPHQRNGRCSSSSYVVPLPLFLVLFLAIFLEKSVGAVSAFEYSKDHKQPSNLTLESIHKYLAKINKPAVLSIESPEGIIDCVDIWKQPAFDHPLLKNHKLQVVPPEIPKAWKAKWDKEKGDSNISSVAASQKWHQNGTRCPEGTVPIKRVTVADVLRAGSVHDFQRKPRKAALAALNATTLSVSPTDSTGLPHEYAIVQWLPGYPVYGAAAAINLWKPHVANEAEMSISQIWLSAGEDETTSLNTIEAGWMVYPRLYNDDETHLFVYWTADGYRSTGCHNLLCPGFIQVDQNIAVGGVFAPLSTFDGHQTEAIIRLYKEQATGNWWLVYGPDYIEVGYWPASLFTSLRESATEVQWGGEVTNTSPGGAHTTTQMGSGHFAEEGVGKASYFRQLNILDSNFAVSIPTSTSIDVDNANCYNLDLSYTLDFMGVHFFYGGPGLGPNCP